MSLSNKNSSKFFNTFKSIIYALLIALFIRYIFIQPFKIPSKSMYPTLLVGDQILVNRISYGLRFPCSRSKIIPGIRNFNRGDSIVFRFPKDSGSIDCPNGWFIGLSSIYYIKRIVGIPGDVISIQFNKIYINGNLISNKTDKNYILDGVNHNIYQDTFKEGPRDIIYKEDKVNFDNIENLVIPEGSFFVLGDNRDNSLDSRFWGFVPSENIIGKAFMIHFSWNNNFKNVKDILRLERFFKSIK